MRALPPCCTPFTLVAPSQVQHALKKSEAALETLNRAIGIDPKNPLCKFHRASILFASDKYKVTSDPLSIASNP